MRWKRGRSSRPDLSALQGRYQAACDAEDYAQQIALLETITAAYPDVSWGWYDLGLRMKWARDWPGSRDANLRAMVLLDDPENGSEAWNLGIAATALGDWALARRAWTAFGVALPHASPDEPIEGDFGLTPIRLNPDPRFAEPAFMLDGKRFDTEVVWARRLCPARARITSVPLPESGHRYGDVVLHDGDPVGQRRFGDSVRSVFNEIALLERGQFATLTTIIDAPVPEGIDSLQSAFAERGYGLEVWTQSVQMLCKACSDGTPGAAHSHPPGRDSLDGTVALGVAAPLEETENLLDPWLEEQGLARGPVLESQSSK